MSELRYDRVTRKVYVEADGKEYGLFLNISGLQQLEAKAGNFFDMFQSESTPSLSVLVFALHVGLNGYKKLKTEEKEQIAQELLNQHGLQGLTGIYFAMLALSGLFPAAVSKNLLESAGAMWRDGGAEEDDDEDMQEEGEEGEEKND